MSTCLIVQHAPHESSFALADALLATGVDVDTCRVFAGDSVPAGTAGLDGVLVMGGAMSATSDGIPGAADRLRATTPAAAIELAPVRNLVCARFAGLIAGRVRATTSQPG